MKPEEILAALATLFDDHKAEVAALQREVAHQTRTAEQWRLSYVEEKRRAEVAEAELGEARTVTDEMVERAALYIRTSLYMPGDDPREAAQGILEAGLKEDNA
jgi:hypothetical protein